MPAELTSLPAYKAHAEEREPPTTKELRTDAELELITRPFVHSESARYPFPSTDRDPATFNKPLAERFTDVQSLLSDNDEPNIASPRTDVRQPRRLSPAADTALVQHGPAIEKESMNCTDRTTDRLSCTSARPCMRRSEPVARAPQRLRERPRKQ